MHFVYQKTINVASEDNYNPNKLFEWFRYSIDADDTIEQYGKETTAQDIVDDIFYKPDNWYDGFIRYFDLGQDVIDNVTPTDISEQIREAIEDKLLDYYTKYLQEFTNWREE